MSAKTYAYLFEAKGIQRYLFGSGKLRDVVGASDLLARIATYDVPPTDLVEAVAAHVPPDQGFSRRGAAAFCAHFSTVQARSRFRALWRLTISTALPGLEFVDGEGDGAHDEAAISAAYKAAVARSNAAAGVVPMGGTASVFAARTGRPAVDRIRSGATVELIDEVLQPARTRSRVIAETTIESDPPTARPAYEALLARVLPESALAQPPLLVPRNLTDEDADTLENPVFAFSQDVDRLALVHADLSGLGEYITNKCRGRTVEYRNAASKEVEAVVSGAVKAALDHVLRLEPRGASETTAYWVKDEKGALLDKPKQVRVRDKLLDSLITKGRTVAVRVAAFRPLVVGGDDVTVLIASPFALAFAETLLEKIEASPLGISACAGIALVKSATPFLMANSLAEDLVKFAKTAAKANARALSGAYRSALAFHSPTGSLGEDYGEVLLAELTAADVRLTAGPYWMGSDRRPSVAGLRSLIAALGAMGGLGGLRSLRTVLADGGKEGALEDWRRWRAIRGKRQPKQLAAVDAALATLGVDKPSNSFLTAQDGCFVTPLFDALTLLSQSGLEEPRSADRQNGRAAA